MTTPTLETNVDQFLAQKRIVVAGVSRNNSHHPAGNLIYRRLKRTGHEATTSPVAAAFMRVLFRVYGAYVVAFGSLATAVAATAFRRGEPWSWWALLVGNTIAFVSAMTYDWTVGAIGPFELTEYLGLAMVWGALAVTAPFRAPVRPAPATADTSRAARPGKP